MRRILVALGLGALMIVGFAARVEPTASGGVWKVVGDGALCQLFPVPSESICVDWFAPGLVEDGTICCVVPANIPRNSFDDCEAAVGKRVRIGGEN